MESPEMVFTLAYLLFCVCFLLTPTEFRSAGITVQGLFSGWLGSEDLDFVRYHARRTTTTMVVHALLPLGYYIGMGFTVPKAQLFYFHKASDSWRMYLLVSLIVPACLGTLGYFWSRNGWGNHPLARALARHVSSSMSWRTAAVSLNTEFRRIDKFATGPPEARVIVTDSWVVKVTPYKVNVAQQRDIHLTLTESRQHSLSPETSSAIQFLTIRVVSITPGVPAFDIRLNSTEYGELREKLHAPIRNARNVVIHQTLSDLFLEAFKTQVELNDCYYMPVGQPQETEPCIGCMQVPATVKLHKQCDGNAEGECQTCFCRPMWCLTCMGKWFASRQDQQHPEVWLSSRAPCPTCRARFCILDVALVR